MPAAAGRNTKKRHAFAEGHHTATAHHPREQPEIMFKVSELFLPFIKGCIRKSVCSVSKMNRLTHTHTKKR